MARHIRAEDRWGSYYRDLIGAKMTWRQIGDAIAARELARLEDREFSYREFTARELAELADPYFDPPKSEEKSRAVVREPKTADDYRRLRAMMRPSSGVPRANLAFEIGQAARTQLLFSSGPVALLAAGHHQHFAGFLATLWEHIEGSPEWRSAFTAFGGVWALFERTVLDELPFLRQTYEFMQNLDDESAFERFVQGMDPIVTPATEIIDSGRESAQARLAFSDSQMREFDSIWEQWSADPQPLHRWPLEFRICYSCCHTSFSLQERDSIAAATIGSFMMRLKNEPTGGRGKRARRKK